MEEINWEVQCVVDKKGKNALRCVFLLVSCHSFGDNANLKLTATT